MSFPKYFATYCVMDGEAGANPFWHASLVLSTQESQTAPVVVDDAIGFYSQPSTTTNPLLKGAKHILGFKIDLQDGHGILKKEVMRDLDGNGLHGISFETTPEQFEQLKASYTEKMALEKKAINELDRYLHKRGEAANGYTRYIAERSLAAIEKREPRLKPFHITMSLTKNGFDSSDSHACKNYALGLLLDNKIIDEKIRDEITGGLSKHAFPRFGSSLAPMRLVSTGEPEIDISRHTGKVFYNRVWERNQLFWATSPHPQNTKPSKLELTATQNPYQLIRNILTRVRNIEMQLRHKISELENTTSRKYRRKKQLEEQLQRVQDLYKEFSVSYQNQLPHCLSAKLLHAETTLNVATMSLTPNRVDYSFMLRAYESIAIRNAMLSLLCLLAATALMSTVVGAVLMTTAGLFATHQFYGFFKEEITFAKMHADYTAFQHTKRQHTPTLEDSHESDERSNYSPTPV